MWVNQWKKFAFVTTLLLSTLAQAQDLVNLEPLTLTIKNFSDLDMRSAIVSQSNFNADDIAQLHNLKFYKHNERTFTIRRTGYPATLFISIYTTSHEGADSNYPIARWEYIEEDNRSEVCHNFGANPPYYIGCSGDNEYDSPVAVINIGNVIPTQQPLPIPSP